MLLIQHFFSKKKMWRYEEILFSINNNSYNNLHNIYFCKGIVTQTFAVCNIFFVNDEKIFNIRNLCRRVC